MKSLNFLILVLSALVISCGPKPESSLITSSAEKNNGIVGGATLNPKNLFSKRVAALIAVTESGQNTLCTGTPISPTILLTAAHCLENAVRMYAYFGNNISDIRNKCKSNDNCPGLIQIIGGKIHFSYVHDSSIVKPGDIAIVKLKEQIPQDYIVSELMGNGNVDTNDLVFLGYGTTLYSRSDSGTLRGVTESLTSLRRTTEENATISSVTCSGDSGGPGFVKSDGKYKILTVNSTVEGLPGTDLCTQLNHGKYIPYYRDWILKELAALK